MVNGKERLQTLLKQNKSVKECVKILGVSERTVYNWKRELQGPEPKDELSIEGNSYKHNIDSGTYQVEVYYDQPPTPEIVIKDHKIDTTKYRLSAFYSKQKSKGWQTTALFKNITPEEEKVESFTKFLKTYKPSFKSLTVKKINKQQSKACLLLLSLCDFHLDKLDINIVPIEERLKHYHDTVDTLLSKSYHSHNLEEIVYVIGNDFYQTDTVLGKTVKETRVAESMTWHKAYEIGFKLLSETIHKLSQYCNKLKVVHIPGNHSESKEYYVAHALEVLFRGNKNITFDRTSDKYKCHVYGETALFLSHGDTIQDKLPLMFAQSFRKEWGLTKYHEICLGDRHHNSEKRVVTSQGESQGVRMRILPALTSLDQWHYDNLYTNAIQAGIALIYDKEKGKCSEFEHRI